MLSWALSHGIQNGVFQVYLNIEVEQAGKFETVKQFKTVDE
jgi:hypothetical protein